MSIYLLLAAIIFLDGLVHILFRVLGKNEKGELPSFSFQILGALIFLPFARVFPPISSVWVYPLLSGFLYGIGGILLLQAYSIGEVSLLAPLSHLSPFLIFLIAVIFLKESLTVSKLAAVTLIIFGLVHLRKKESFLLSLKAIFNDKACQFYFLFLLFFSLARTVDKKATLFFQTTTYTFLQYFLPSLFALSYIMLKRESDELKNFLHRKFPLAALTGLVVGLRYASFFKAISLTELSRVSPAVSLSTVVALTMSRLFLKERIESRWIAAVFMIAGAVILMYRF